MMNITKFAEQVKNEIASHKKAVKAYKKDDDKYVVVVHLGHYDLTDTAATITLENGHPSLNHYTINPKTFNKNLAHFASRHTSFVKPMDDYRVECEVMHVIDWYKSRIASLTKMLTNLQKALAA